MQLSLAEARMQLSFKLSLALPSGGVPALALSVVYS